MVKQIKTLFEMKGLAVLVGVRAYKYLELHDVVFLNNNNSAEC
jgi:hypothetical protein